MRAVTGTITATRPSSTVKAARILQRFEESAPSGLLSSDAATYLRTAIEAAAELNQFRSYLRLHQQREGGGESERKRRPASVDEDSRWEPKVEEEDEYSRWEPKVEEEDEYGMMAPAAAEKKSSERKASREDEEPWQEKQGTATEKRRKKKEKRVKDEDEAGDAIEEQSRKALGDALRGMVSKEGIGSGKKKKKHIKQEDLGAEEAEQKMVHVGVAENGLASEEKRRKKRKHTEEKEVKKEVVDDGDLGSDKKRKKKRGRDGDNGNDTELVEHTKKKQRK
ncbi:unnamed protein product [Alopecurus aequalis]